MAERLRSSVSPYLRSHADNPVDWFPWGEEAFAEAKRRDVPLLISIGYATCHWCHVMARESFSDPMLAAQLNEGFVAVKVDREEHPDVDTAYLRAASAFTRQLGWPLTAFATPAGETFFAGTYFPPRAVGGVPAFADVLTAVSEAWRLRRDEVQATAGSLAAALREATASLPAASTLPDDAALESAVAALAAEEDRVYGGFGGAPKFPVAPVLGFLATRASGAALAERTLLALAASPLRDHDGGFFRYATQADWSEPHYERMLYDNAQLLDVAALLLGRAGTRSDEVAGIAEGIASFLVTTLQRPSGGFASAQDSESIIDGQRSEGGYYLAADRSRLVPPSLDEKVVTGWNGLAIRALARAGRALGRAEWIEAARRAADFLLRRHVVDGRVSVRASLGDAVSAARPVLEDLGMLAGGLLQLALAEGRPRYAVVARSLLDGAVDAASGPLPFALPGGGDPALTARGLLLAADPSEGAYPSGLAATAEAAHELYLLTGQRRYRVAAEAVVTVVAPGSLAQPMGFGAVLALASRLARPVRQLVLVAPCAAGLADLLRGAQETELGVLAGVSDEGAREWAEAGFELFEGRVSRDALPTAYSCESFVCALPSTRLPEEIVTRP
ncbi:thioredoxin domain-containing protein [Rathayibacter iranicus]|uniref:Thioredoxin domain-containing protein n=2 Tax=Rathayibacter iranicus TaxID=59737 RepID=A0AAD1ACG7_9MICO|nr:DUF255 domain-containing protein [Rathayibacter iranicus]AZZ54500.1 thioredoxin domain-containing protein [Rathayibacter iranicus]MWV29927.1 DUF255 domain-containing protein [Rathayibacter iranicus NCPPB 2253 = VKM Ac-1602]PPI51675.1 thioredoxin domain-containing protein [Rathayibacter iranicus]PPI63844.1 thioredoxin domain-containing protein [Rathayibacter iranicus]PPI74689.1 thioredoxin domain-containing protein [Rathayibacter iranicus]